MRPDGPRESIVGPNTGPEAPFPLKLGGEVIKGFGRGSKEVRTFPSSSSSPQLCLLYISGICCKVCLRYYFRNWLVVARMLIRTYQLGIPTANIPIEGLTVGGQKDLESGIYFGWAGLEYPDAKPSPEGQNGAELTKDVFPMVMSVGWNPFYKNEKRSVVSDSYSDFFILISTKEVHIIHQFDKDFYGGQLNLLILGFIRPEYDYVSKEALIKDIEKDIDVTLQSLARPAYQELKSDSYLRSFADS